MRVFKDTNMGKKTNIKRGIQIKREIKRVGKQGMQKQNNTVTIHRGANMLVTHIFSLSVSYTHILLHPLILF